MWTTGVQGFDTLPYTKPAALFFVKNASNLINRRIVEGFKMIEKLERFLWDKTNIVPC